jgi:hypothetical protein
MFSIVPVKLKQDVSQLESTNKELMERINELSGANEKVEVLFPCSIASIICLYESVNKILYKRIP